MARELAKNETPIPELGNRSWNDLELIEDDQGRLLFKDQIRLRTKEGWKAVPVRVRVPRALDMAKARRDARQLMAEEKLDETRDKALFEELEQACVSAVCIRDPATLGQLADARELLSQYDDASLIDVRSRINLYKELVDPREFAELTDTRVFELVMAIQRHGHLGPLVDIAGDAQPSFIMRMVGLAWTSPIVQSYAQSLVTSTPAESPPVTSSAS